MFIELPRRVNSFFVGCVNNPRVAKKLGKEILKTNLSGQRKKTPKTQRKGVKERVISEMVVLVVTRWVRPV